VYLQRPTAKRAVTSLQSQYTAGNRAVWDKMGPSGKLPKGGKEGKTFPEISRKAVDS
jgi:hypothetical protein